MAQIKTWCDPVEELIKNNRLRILTADAARISLGVDALAAIVPVQYASAKRSAALLRRLGKDKAAKYLEQKLPTSSKIRSGDLGEILASAYVTEFTPFSVSVNRLQWKDHRDMAMRGEDIIAVQLDPTVTIKFLKGEAKSNVSLSTTTVTKARKALRHNNGRPTAHALSFLADRLHESGEHDLADRIDDAQLLHSIELNQLAHLMFTFSENDPSKVLRADLTGYSGKIEQHSVGIRVKNHQAFIKSVFEKVVADGIK
jgi:hypothetical protein